jgi:hypothetical protein
MIKNQIQNGIFFIIIIFIPVIFGCTSNSNMFSSRIDPVGDAKKVLFDFYDFYKEANYTAASDYILKDDLDEYKEFFSPLLAKMIESNDTHSLFWDKMIIFSKNTEEVSSKEFFAACLEWSMAILGDFQDLMKGTEIEIINWHQTNNFKTIIFEYKVMNYLKKYESRGFDTLIFQDERWYIKLKISQLMTQYNTIDIPEWVKYGLSIDEVKKSLGITNFSEITNLAGITSLGTLEYGIGSELGLGVGIYMDDSYYFFPFFQLLQLIKGEKSREEMVGYGFSFDSQNKLTTLTFLSNHSYINLLNNFTNKYGMPLEINWENFYAVHGFTENLPDNIGSISITQLSQKDGSRVVIFYMLK